MPYTVFTFQYRQPSLSPEAYADHYENVHLPLVQAVTGDAFPKKHTRYYIKRGPASSDDTNAVGAPLVFYGQPEDIGFDCVAIMEFEDLPAFIRFKDAYEKSPRKQEMDDDEAKFLVKSKLQAFAVEDARITTA